MSKKIGNLLRYCEENFEKGNLEAALRLAVSVSVANPNAPEPYAHVTAYRILLAAENYRTITGEPNYYAILGIKRGSSSNSIDRRCLELLELLNGEVGVFKAVSRVYELMLRGVDVLKNQDTRAA